VIQVRNQFAKDPGLIRIRHAAMAMLENGLGDDPPPGQVVNGNPFELLPGDVEGQFTGARGDLVRDRDDAAEAMGARHVDVAAHLVASQGHAPGLHFYERAPTRTASFNHDCPVGDGELAVFVLQLDLGVRRDPSAGRARGSEERVTEVRYCSHDGKQRRSGSSLLFLLAADPRYGNQARRVPARLGAGKRIALGHRKGDFTRRIVAMQHAG
jgi:hypothetical protein